MEPEKNESSFIRQTIKGKPLSKKNLLIRLLIVCAFAAAAAVVAAFVFVNMVPVAQRASGQITPPPRVTIPAGEATSTVTPEPEITETPTPSPTKTPTPEPTDTPTPTDTPKPTDTPELSEEPAAETEEPTPEPTPVPISIDQYLDLQNSMLDIASEAEKSMVVVTAISSQMDYFNQSVENRIQISGVIIAATDEAFYILTESRIFNNIERIQVTFSDSTVADAIFQKGDPDTGLAVLKVNTDDISEETLENISVASLGSSYSVRTGDTVVALGSPNGYSNSISFGRITSIDTVIPAYDCEYNLLATDITGTPDGSGILINLNGMVIGIIDQSFGGAESQIVTGISISQLKTLIEQLSNGESRAYIGIKGSEVTASISEITGIPRGIIILGVAEESPAFFAGLSDFDVLSQIGDEKISSMSQYKNVLSHLEPGEKVTLTILRKGAEGYTEIEFEIETGEI